MNDRRLTPANGRAALASLRGTVTAESFVPGEPARISVPLADLLDHPAGGRDRQLLLGETVTVIERHQGWAFLRAAKDGYCGYVSEAALGAARAATHRVIAPATHVYPEPSIRAREIAALSFGARLTVLTGGNERFAETTEGFVPRGHLAPVGENASDPVAVARLFLGTPYLWGGNSRAGMDCSGLVQTALHACGVACPGDSDLQMQSVGTELPPGAAPHPGDLVFWRGHVAMVADEVHLIHATAHAMATVVEGIDAAISRIAAAGYPVLVRRRP